MLVESNYDELTKAILNEVTLEVCKDAGIEPVTADGSIDKTVLPAFFKSDFDRFDEHRNLLASRSIAIAYITIARELSSKMKNLAVKKKADEDTQMGGTESTNKTVQQVVQEEIRKMLPDQQKKSVKPNAGKWGAPVALAPLKSDANFWSIKRPSPDGTRHQTRQPTQEKSLQPAPERQNHGRRKRKREWEEEISKELALLGRVLSSSGAAGGCDPSVAAFTKVSGKRRTLENTACAQQFLEKHFVFSDVSEKTRQIFVLRHSPVDIIEFKHDFASGIFMGPGVQCPPYIEWDLSRNAKFIMHEAPNDSLVYEAWNKLERSIRLRWHFRNSKSAPPRFYTSKRTWQPPLHQRNRWIEKGLVEGKALLLHQVQQASLNLGKARKSNPDLQSIHEFLRQRQFLVKLTDKNLGLAVVSKSWYLDLCAKMLADTKVYRQISATSIGKVKNYVTDQISNLVDEYDLPTSVVTYLEGSVEDDSVPRFHAIPKVHKKVWTLRPIIPSHSWITRRCSEVADFLLRQCIKEVLPWCVESTRHVVQLLQKETIIRSDDIWLVTGDVEAFYTNVPIDDTINGISNLIGSKKYDGISTDILRTLLESVMKCNMFEFQGKYYHQKQGVAMGTSCAPAFANLSLGILEIATSMINFDKKGLRFYVRYIDDIFLIFKGTKTHLETWLKDFTAQLLPYKVSWNFSSCRETLPFLDLEFFFRFGHGPVGLQHQVFRKRMNKHQYIPWSSAHPETVKKSFVKAELTRFMVNSSLKELFEERVDEFLEALRRRGYPEQTLQKWRKQVSYNDRASHLLKQKETSRLLPLMLPSKYNEIWEYIDMQSVASAMRPWWEKAGELPDSLKAPLIKSLRRTESLFDKVSVWNKEILNDGIDSTLPGELPSRENC
ncbi:hypothetical protein BBAD15_g12516 [Beauveria bassiana D1-5]|uniref:Reverse transcriptase domain-containing protein n=1 Tax=Beauveria bassiana D1-5 TaxID=1245745 RepID=A0A0A2V852_BEABA|nr:hypothetical protein BBAD15_g12516 [Beauveria bassiana D1-5]